MVLAIAVLLAVAVAGSWDDDAPSSDVGGTSGGETTTARLARAAAQTEQAQLGHEFFPARPVHGEHAAGPSGWGTDAPQARAGRDHAGKKALPGREGDSRRDAHRLPTVFPTGALQHAQVDERPEPPATTAG